MPKNLVSIVGLLSLFVIGLNIVFYPNNILSYDVFGYYLYLPTTFLFQDLGLENKEVIVQLIEQYKSTSSFYQVNPTEGGLFVMKYSMGMAFMYFPFFLLGWLGAILFEYPIDGFSAPFQLAIFIGGITYSIIGLWFTAKVLNHFFNWKTAAIALSLIVFGTNYMVHVGMYGQNAMSQNYLFTAYALVLWFTIKWHETYKVKYAVFLGLIMSVAILSRPTEIVMLAIPVLWGVYAKETLISKLEIFWKYRMHVLLIVVMLGAFGGMQLVYWKIFTGKFLYNSYGGNPGEGLELFSPYTWQFLFSFRKGWLLYTPLMLFSFSGFVWMYRKNKEIVLPLLSYVVLNIYIISSWSNWWYAQSFSQRAMVSSYPVMAILLAYFIQWLFSLKGIKRGLMTSVISLLVLLNIIQTIQFDKGIIHADRMTKEAYFSVFGQLNQDVINDDLLLINRSFDGKEVFKNQEAYRLTKSKVQGFEEQGNYTEKVNSGNKSFQLNKDVIYTPSVEMSYEDITSKKHAWIRVSAYVYVEDSALNNPFSLVVQFTHKGYAYKYRTLDLPLENMVSNQWVYIEMEYLSPEVRNKTDLLKTFIWNRGDQNVLVDDLKVAVFEKK